MLVDFWDYIFPIWLTVQQTGHNSQSLIPPPLPVQWGELEKTLAANLKQNKNQLTEKNRLQPQLQLH